MQLLRYPARQPAPTPSAVAIGNFDGLHLGHQAVIAQMKTLAAEQGLVPTVLTFEPHPRAFFAPHSAAFRLEPVHMKLRHLRAEGVARVAAPRFNAAFATLTPDQFLDGILGRALQAKVIVTGENFAFGNKRAGSSATLRAWGEANNVVITTVRPVILADGTICSSTAVRQALSESDMERARILLGRPYQISGRVVHGDHRGREIGFPTANVSLPVGVKLPGYGVYAVRVTRGNRDGSKGKTYNGVANFGLRPTIGDATAPRLEVHLFDFTGELYGARLTVDFFVRIREEKRFASLGALTSQIAEDCLVAKTALQHGAP